MPLHDRIDAGVFNGGKNEEKSISRRSGFLNLRRASRRSTAIRPTRVRGGLSAVAVRVVGDRMPTRAGIDPCNKLIDRDSEDDWMAVTKQ
jgi:hypothetical protein